ncbi:hypothetical protein MTO96_045669 [Rhipicephalus appendiculatus]
MRQLTQATYTEMDYEEAGRNHHLSLGTAHQVSPATEALTSFPPLPPTGAPSGTALCAPINPLSPENWCTEEGEEQ